MPLRDESEPPTGTAAEAEEQRKPKEARKRKKVDQPAAAASKKSRTHTASEPPQPSEGDVEEEENVVEEPPVPAATATANAAQPRVVRKPVARKPRPQPSVVMERLEAEPGDASAVARQATVEFAPEGRRQLTRAVRGTSSRYRQGFLLDEPEAHAEEAEDVVSGQPGRHEVESPVAGTSAPKRSRTVNSQAPVKRSRTAAKKSSDATVSFEEQIITTPKLFCFFDLSARMLGFMQSDALLAVTNFVLTLIFHRYFMDGWMDTSEQYQTAQGISRTRSLFRMNFDDDLSLVGFL